MRVLMDTNVVLDVLLKREPWVKDSAAAWLASDEGRIIGHITASTLTDIFYISKRLGGLDVARQAVRTWASTRSRSAQLTVGRLNRLRRCQEMTSKTMFKSHVPRLPTWTQSSRGTRTISKERNHTRSYLRSCSHN